MIRQFANLGNASGIEIECDAPCTVLEGNMWQMLLKNLSGNIIFIDEENQFIRQQEFAELVKASDNYFVIITRENLYNLPYSVEEIYGLYSSKVSEHKANISRCIIYQKSKLNPTYLHEKNKNIILKNIKNSIDF